MRVGLVGPTYQERSLNFDAQRSVNFYPVFDKEGKEVAALYGTPGLSLFAEIGTGPIRGMFRAANDRAFVVSGSSLYEVDSSGNTTLRGGLKQSQGIVSMAENGFDLAICDGASVYLLTFASNNFAQVTDIDLPQSGTLTFIDGYFVVNSVGTGGFYISGLYDADSWEALDFATAEASPDDLLRVFTAVGQLWLLGGNTTEVWTNTGDSTFPFERIAGAKMDVGIAAPHSAAALDNSIIWLGRDENGAGIVYRTTGFSARRISTHAIEQALQRANNVTQIRAWTYQEGGHLFYVLTGGGLETSLCYDLTTQLWHERAYLNEAGEFEQHRASCAMYAFDKILVGDRESGKVYHLSHDYYSDDGDAMASDRIYTHIANEGQRIRANTLEIGIEGGVGLIDGQGSDPKILMRLSKDGAHTWTDWHEASMGRIGQYNTTARFRRLGLAEQMTFHIRITDPVKRAICGSYLR